MTPQGGGSRRRRKVDRGPQRRALRPGVRQLSADKGTIDVSISEDKPIYLSRLLRPDDSVTISTLARIRLANPPLAFSRSTMKKEGVRVNGSPAGNYNLDGCTIEFERRYRGE